MNRETKLAAIIAAALALGGLLAALASVPVGAGQAVSGRVIQTESRVTRDGVRDYVWVELEGGAKVRLLRYTSEPVKNGAQALVRKRKTLVPGIFDYQLQQLAGDAPAQN